MNLAQLFRFRWLRLVILLSLSWLILARPAAPAAAHPLGNFTISRYTRLEFHPGEVRLKYIVDMAEIPTFQLWPLVDQDGDGKVDAAESERYRQQLLDEVQPRLKLQAGRQALLLQADTTSLTLPEGQGGLPTLRFEALFNAPLPAASSPLTLSYQDDNYLDRLGWQEVVVQAGEGVTLLRSSAPATDLSQELRSYPENLLQSPLQVRTAEIELAFSAAALPTVPLAGMPANQTGAQSNPDRFGADQLANLITTTTLGPAALGLALMTAFGLGAAHALTPGHGKTVVGAYLVGSRGTARHALFLGLTTTFTHTAGVFLFGLLVLFASRFILPEQLYPWLGVLSGLMVAVIGFTLLRAHWRRWRGYRDPREHEPGYHTHFGVGHTHLPPEQQQAPYLDPHEHDHHHHDHAHGHHHDHDHDHHHHEHDHHHGRDHHHPTPEAITWRSLLALGISGGLLPCPSALVLLLAAIALNRVGLGLVLILMFSLGLAAVLTGIGLLMVYAGRLMERLPAGSGRLTQALPVISALFITLAGLIITLQAATQTGLL